MKPGVKTTEFWLALAVLGGLASMRTRSGPGWLVAAALMSRSLVLVP